MKSGPLPVLAACMALAWSTDALAADAALVTPAGVVSVRVDSLREARFHRVIRQQYDFSCGSAAVATLLTHHYGRPTSEEEAFRSMFAVGDSKAIRQYGFSLFDMQRYLATLGLKADGFRMDIDKLAQVGVPAITLVNQKGYNHFVVVKGLDGGDVLVGDPAMGVKVISRPEFEAQWQGIMFVIRDDLAMGRQHFNVKEEWSVRRKAPFGTALSRQGPMAPPLALPGLFEF